MRSFFFVLGSIAVLAAACGSDPDTAAPSSSSGGADGGPKTADAGPAVCTPNTVAPDVRAVSCAVTIQRQSLQEPASKHLPENTAIDYCSNPPTSGPHYAVWSSFAEFTQPVDWPYLVHSEEHGAVLLLYKCAEACPEIVDELRKVKERAPADCGGAKRIIIAPVPTLPTKVAASAWGINLTADCADGPTLDEFVRTNIGKGPEDICVPGRTFQ